MNSTIRAVELSPDTYARIAGILYLAIIVFGISGEVFFRGSLIATGDALATTQNILASEMTFRGGFFVDSMMLLCDVAIAVLFYALFRPVSPVLSLMAAVFRLIQAAVLGSNLINYHAVQLLLDAHANTSGIVTDTVSSQVWLLLEMHAHGYDLGLLFFAMSNVILGYLIVRSRLFPVIIGYGLWAAAIVYLLGGYVSFLLPALSTVIEPIYLIPFVAELAFCMWLLVKGVRDYSIN